MTRVLEYLELRSEADGDQYGCLKCGQVIGPADRDYKTMVAHMDAPMSVGQPAWLQPQESRYVLRHHCCPSCGVAFEVDMMPAEDEAIESLRLDR
jgi:predicted RNA-binding Zn-ribbon protein involved in translation (DUF1610 family)